MPVGAKWHHGADRLTSRSRTPLLHLEQSYEKNRKCAPDASVAVDQDRQRGERAGGWGGRQRQRERERAREKKKTKKHTCSLHEQHLDMLVEAFDDP